ncbi:uncharacterized protein LOC126851896 [Cataglyphis hispanica]|uniref:uncharacterized protein LOC126851896 n=1 Tax=Cataglyphis hispanica TaxID=1086592 RepID=UPI00217F76BD|nr:uncharacterized protein LOC126851896 [Cataglyphis hispanica]
MTDILNIRGEPVFDDHIVKIETHTYNQYANTTDLYALSYESFLYIVGKLTINKPAEGYDVALGNNCIAFDKIRYEHDGMEIDHNRNVGITSTLKNYLTIPSDRIVIMKNVGWDAHTNANGYFNFCVPFYMLFGFCEDYRCAVINAFHELILIRSRNDNCLIGNLALEPVIDIFKIQWRMPHVILNDINKLSMLRALESGRYLSMGFRGICTSFRYCSVQPNIRRPLRPRLNWRSRDTLSSLYRQVERISCPRI